MIAKKKNSEAIDFEEMAKLTGGQLLKDLESVKYFIDVGNLAMNYICSGKFIDGGIPAGKITEISGPSSSGKSYWATNALRGVQAIDGLPFYLDIENALDPEFAQRTSHIDVDRIIRSTPDTMEATFNKMYNVIPKIRDRFGMDKALLFVYDSLSASCCEREFKELNLPENYTKADWKRIVGFKEQPGERAKVCSREFRKLDKIISKNNTTVLIINQIRQKIGIAYGDPTTTSGGLALQFHAGCRIRTQPSKKIVNKNKVVVGVKLRAKNIKNRCFTPFKEVDGISLFFETGLNPVSGLLDVLQQCNRIKKTGKGIYKVSEEFTNGEEVLFKANKEDQIVPVDLLIKNYKLIDAVSSDQVESYFSIFKDAIEQSLDPNNTEKSISEFGEEGELTDSDIEEEKDDDESDDENNEE